MSKTYVVYADGSLYIPSNIPSLYLSIACILGGIFSMWVGFDTETAFFVVIGVIQCLWGNAIAVRTIKKELLKQQADIISMFAAIPSQVHYD